MPNSIEQPKKDEKYLKTRPKTNELASTTAPETKQEIHQHYNDISETQRDACQNENS